MRKNKKANPALTKLATRYAPQIQILIRISLLLFAVGIILSLEIDFDILLIMSGYLIAILFFISAFDTEITIVEEDQENLPSIGLIIFFKKLNYLSLAISSVAIVLLLVQAEKNNAMAVVGALTLVVATLFQVFILIKSNGKLVKTELFLTSFLFIITLALFIILL